MSKRTATIRLQDEVNCVITGLHPDHAAALFEDYGIFAPNYFFQPKFKLGQWDGKIRFFHKNGKTFINLLDEIIPKIVKFGYSIGIDDKRQSKPIDVELVTDDIFSTIVDEYNNPIKLRYYQVDIVNALIEAKGGVAIAGTGAGKTLICAALAVAYEKQNCKTIIIVPDKNLIEQTRDNFIKFGVDTGDYYGDSKDLNHIHIVSTWQALKNNPSILNNFHVVIVDECHGIKGRVLQDLLNEHGKHIQYRYGVTGTLPKEEADQMAVQITVGSVRYSKSAKELIDEGYLAKLHIDVLQMDVDLKKPYEDFKTHNPTQQLTYTQFKDSYFPEWSAEREFMQTEKARLKYLAHFIDDKRNEGKGNVLCLVSNIDFGKRLTKLIPNAVFVYGKDKMKDRKLVYDLFKSENNLVVIANVQVASTGLDIARIFNMIYIDMGKSFIRTIQSIGRGLRKAPDKDFLQVTDICTNLKYSKKHVRERINYYSEAQYPYKKRIIEYNDGK